MGKIPNKAKKKAGNLVEEKTIPHAYSFLPVVFKLKSSRGTLDAQYEVECGDKVK